MQSPKEILAKAKPTRIGLERHHQARGLERETGREGQPRTTPVVETQPHSAAQRRPGGPWDLDWRWDSTGWGGLNCKARVV
jgi:hypothetical protein